MTTSKRRRAIAGDVGGRAAHRFVFASCGIAFAAALATPGFETNPLIGGVIHDLRNHLPATLDQVRRAMGG